MHRSKRNASPFFIMTVPGRTIADRCCRHPAPVRASGQLENRVVVPVIGTVPDALAEQGAPHSCTTNRSRHRLEHSPDSHADPSAGAPSSRRSNDCVQVGTVLPKHPGQTRPQPRRPAPAPAETSPRTTVSPGRHRSPEWGIGAHKRPYQDDNSVDGVGHCNECVHNHGWESVGHLQRIRPFRMRTSDIPYRCHGGLCRGGSEPPLRVVDADGIGYAVDVGGRTTKATGGRTIRVPVGAVVDVNFDGFVTYARGLAWFARLLSQPAKSFFPRRRFNRSSLMKA